MPKFPLYIPSKGRSNYMMTSKHLTAQGVHHNVVVEPDEVADYQTAVDQQGLLATIIPLDMSYKAKYELCDDLGLSKTTGSGPARNFIWDHSIANGHEMHWIMDDNIAGFYRFNHNLRIRCKSSKMWDCMEDFVLRYENVAMAGPNYRMFVVSRSLRPPFVINTRIYSCNLIRNDVPFRWRGRYNEDTILSLDMLKADWCTIQFNAFLQDKISTQLMSGGNTAELYKDGTLAKSQMLVNCHPDVASVVEKYARWHHHVNYLPFKPNKLIRKADIVIPQGINEYGMVLKQ